MSNHQQGHQPPPEVQPDCTISKDPTWTDYIVVFRIQKQPNQLDQLRPVLIRANDILYADSFMLTVEKYHKEGTGHFVRAGLEPIEMSRWRGINPETLTSFIQRLGPSSPVIAWLKKHREHIQ